MILTDLQIEKALDEGTIKITDFTASRLNPNSYNLRLDNKLYVYENTLLDLRTIKNSKMREIIIPEEGVILAPDMLYIGSTFEYTETHTFVPKIDGRSSIGRAGLFVHVTAGFGDIGFCGKWTLEIVAVQPIRIYPYIEICQISYLKPYGKCRQAYQGKYQHNKQAQGSQFEI
jgi:dCTP deaminase